MSAICFRKSLPSVLVVSLLAAPFVLPPRGARADVCLPAILSEHMVLQKTAKVPIWGKADPGEKITVTLDGQRATATAGAGGRWMTSLDLAKSGPGPFEMTVEGKNRLMISDVLVGEVWVAAGQSNMKWALGTQTIGAEKEIAQSANPQFRQFRVAKVESDTPKEEALGQWVVATPQTTPEFSATAYYFAKRLLGELKVPVGIINTAVSGTPVEAWLSMQAVDTVPHLKEARERAVAALKASKPAVAAAASKPKARHATEPSCLFNGLIHPILNYGIAGIIWYQGESNEDRAWQYRFVFPLLIQDWRNQWKQPNRPFYFCQLANFKQKQKQPSESAWAEIREGQSMALKLPNTAEAVLIDIGESNDIHPKNKQETGTRLANVVLANHYGKAIPFSGPVYESMKVEGDKIRVAFTHTEGGLVAKALPATYIVKTTAGLTAPLVRNSPKSELEGFAICGADHKWVWADAKIDGTDVLVWSDQVPAPVAVRYAWADNPTCNLTNAAGLPATPFRTDDLPALTRDVLY